MSKSDSDYSEAEEQQLQADLEQRLTSYIAGDASIHALRDWPTQRSWRVNPENKRLWGLYSMTRSRLFDFDDGDWTQEELRDSLAHLLAFFRDGQTELPDPMRAPRDGYVPIRSWRPRPPSGKNKE